MNKPFSSVTQVLRGYTYNQVKAVVEVLVDSPVHNVEVTMNTPEAALLIQKLSSEYGSNINIGAGTVLTLEELKIAHRAGATFVLAPTLLSEEMFDYCKEHEILSVPGAFTPTEIAHAFALGADIVKVFPANEVSYSYAKKVCEPLGNLPLMAVGGVTTQNIAEVFAGGYAYAGTANGIFNKNDILAENKTALKQSVYKLTEELECLGR